MSGFFELISKSDEARAGVLKLEHGEVKTPIFMPVGTRASVKTLRSEQLEEIGVPIILGNTYHLYLRPGHKLIEDSFGDLHTFMSWKKPILTDSGGFQVFSLSDLGKVTEEGVRFQSHIDGSYHMFSPEKSMEIQKSLGSDIAMCFDECPSLPASKDRLRESLELTMKWARRSKNYPLRNYQKLFGIIQGGLFDDLRTESLERLMDIGFDGYALGGLSVGEKNEEMIEFCKNFVPKMPQHAPRYLMGVGKPLDILNGIRAGLDMFDCVLPTRNARNGQIFTDFGPLNIKKSKFAEESMPLDPNCSCAICKRYSRGYIRHLFTVGELASLEMLTYHNIYYFIKLVERAREAILNDSFETFYQTYLENYNRMLYC